MKRVVGASRYLAVIGVIGFGVLSLVTFLWAGAKTVSLVDDLLAGAWKRNGALIALLKAVDLYLLAVVLLIVSLGLYELFIGDLDLPRWLQVGSFDALKKSVVDVLVVFVAIRGIEVVFTSPDAADGLMNVGAVALLIATLTFFRWRPSGKAAPPGAVDPPH